jgi:hypothetical protein
MRELVGFFAWATRRRGRYDSCFNKQLQRVSSVLGSDRRNLMMSIAKVLVRC